jgi:hypothetical protein
MSQPKHQCTMRGHCCVKTNFSPQDLPPHATNNLEHCTTAACTSISTRVIMRGRRDAGLGRGESLTYSGRSHITLRIPAECILFGFPGVQGIHGAK